MITKRKNYLFGNDAALINIIIRCSGLGVRYIFLFVLAKELSVNEFALFGIIAAGVGYFTVVIGFELHNQFNRDIAIGVDLKRSDLIGGAMCIYISLCILIAPLLTLIFFVIIGDAKFTAMFFFVLCFEYISMEVARILIYINRQLLSSTVMFVRSASWCIFVFLLNRLFGVAFNLELILCAWSLAAFISCLFGVYCINYIEGLTYLKLNKKMLIGRKKGAMIMFFVALTYQAFFFLDRLYIKSYGDSQLLSMYIIYAASATSLLAILDAGVISMYAGKLMFAANHFSRNEFMSILKSFFIKVVILCFVSAPIIAFATIELLDFIGHKSTTSASKYFLIYIFISIIIFGVGTVPHLALYALKKEFMIMKIQVISLFIFSVAGLFVVRNFPAVSLPMLMSFIFLLITLWKTSELFKEINLRTSCPRQVL